MFQCLDILAVYTQNSGDEGVFEKGACIPRSDLGLSVHLVVLPTLPLFHIFAPRRPNLVSDRLAQSSTSAACILQ